MWVSKHISQIIESVKNSKVTISELNELKSFKILCNRERKAISIDRKWSLKKIFALIATFLIFYQIKSEVKLPYNLLTWQVETEPCIVETSSTIQEIFRPPVDCSMCRDIQDVDRVTNVTRDHFQARYAYTGRPVIVEDGQANWTAPDVFSFDFFRNTYRKNSPILENFEEYCQFFPYKTEFQGLTEVFDMDEERISMKGEPWYIGWSNCDYSATNVLRSHYQRPYFLPRNSLSSRTDWIFMGTPGNGAHMHIDHVSNPSWQAQIQGEKLWVLKPPHECYFQCNTLEVVVRKGDIIVLDTNIWYHSTRIVSSDLSITIGSEYD